MSADQERRSRVIEEIKEVLDKLCIDYTDIIIRDETIIIEVPDINKANISWLKSIQSFSIELKKAQVAKKLE